MSDVHDFTDVDTASGDDVDQAWDDDPAEECELPAEVQSGTFAWTSTEVVEGSTFIVRIFDVDSLYAVQQTQPEGEWLWALENLTQPIAEMPSTLLAPVDDPSATVLAPSSVGTMTLTNGVVTEWRFAGLALGSGMDWSNLLEDDGSGEERDLFEAVDQVRVEQDNIAAVNEIMARDASDSERTALLRWRPGTLLLIGNHHSFHVMLALGDDYREGTLVFKRNRIGVNELRLSTPGWDAEGAQYVQDLVKYWLSSGEVVHPFRGGPAGVVVVPG